MSKELKNRVLRLVLNCVRNTALENLHAGTYPDSKAGDYSDVKVVSPYGEISWSQLSRLSDDEMKALMIEVVNKVYSFLLYEEQLSQSIRFMTPKNWNEPQIDGGFIKHVRTVVASGEISNSVAILEDLITSWCDYSADPTIFEHTQYYKGILMGLTSAGKISLYENQTIWLPRTQKRQDALLAIRRSIKQKKIRVKDPVDVNAIEAGKWIAFDYDGKAMSNVEDWEVLWRHREQYALTPVVLTQLSNERPATKA